MDMNQKKKLVAKLSISSNIILTILKIIAGIVSGSMSIISEAIHSLSDFFASVITFFSVVKSSQPADADHPYGHGKYEDLAGFIEGILIVAAAVIIILKSFEKIILGHAVPHENYLGIMVMAIAVVVNIIVSSLLFKVAKESNSVSLYADGEHLRTDVYSSLGILLGLILIKVTGHTILDPIIAIIVGAFIFRAGYSISKKSLWRLLDHALPKEDITKIKTVINTFSGKMTLKPNSIKTRQVGPSKDISLVLQFPKDISLCECHQLCDEVEKKLKTKFKNCTIIIHSEPICYKKDCENCR